MTKDNQKYVIGVDGGGTKTTTALADLKGRVLIITETGSSSPRNVGIASAAESVAKGINKVWKKNINLTFIFIGLPAVEEEYKDKKEKIKKEVSQRISKELSSSKIKIGSDQLVAFRSGTNQKEGVILIAGTGCVAHGWRGKMESKASGWGWLADEGSAFWTGKQVLEAALKDIDGRAKRTTLTKMVLGKFKVKGPEKLIEKIYKRDFVGKISLLSVLCDRAAEKGDKIAQEILKRGAFEASLTLRAVIKKLGFNRKQFPIVLVGSMFESEIFLKTLKFKIRSLAPRAKIILPKNKAVIGAIKLAIELL